jgi:hypothetical protein
LDRDGNAVCAISVSAPDQGTAPRTIVRRTDGSLFATGLGMPAPEVLFETGDGDESVLETPGHGLVGGPRALITGRRRTSP